MQMERPLESVPRWSLYGAGWPPWTRWLAALAVGASLMACIALIARRDGGTRIGDVWVVSLTVTNAIVCCLLAAADARAGTRRFWRLLAIGFTAIALGQSAWALRPFAASPELFTTGALAFYMLGACAMVPALLLFRTDLRRAAERTTLVLDLTASLLMGAMLIWFLMRRVNPEGSVASWTHAAPVMVVLPGLQLLTVVAFGSLFIRLANRADRRGIGTFGAGLAVQLLSHVSAAWQPFAPTPASILLNGTGTLLVLLGLLLQFDRSPLYRIHQPRVQRLSCHSVLPYASILAGYAMLLELGSRTNDVEVMALICGMVVLTLLVIVRQAVAVREDSLLCSDEAREASETRFRSLVQHSTDLITIIDGADVVRYASPAITRVFGYESDALEGTTLRELVHPEDVVSMLGFLSDAAKPDSRATTAYWRMKHATGSWCQVENVAVNLLADPNVTGLVLTTRDVTHRVTMEEQLMHRAFHDELTGLANRALFTNRVELALLRASRTALSTAVLFLDLDDFKEVNDSMGHAAGDALLTQGADRLRACLRAGDTAARLGGDEFAVLLEELSDDGLEMANVSGRIAAAFARSFTLDEGEAFVTASIGVALSTGAENGEALLRNADLAMYLAKKRGKARIEHFESHMHEEVVERLDLLADLRYAIERNELQLEYQPIVDLVTRQVSGLETLVRWDHPRRGRIAPADFIPIAEQSGLIISIGRWVLLHACAHARHWSRTLPELHPVTVTVNLSARQLGDENLLDDVANALRVAGLRRDQLVLELTETTLLANSEEIVDILTSLKSLGVRLAIDDFGTGYSSLSYLHRFPVDVLKIDKSFVHGVAGGPGASALASAVIALGNSLGLRTVAEGIENEAQYDALLKLGCKFGQGFLFSRPLPTEDVMPYLIEHGQRPSSIAPTHRLTPLSTPTVS